MILSVFYSRKYFHQTSVLLVTLRYSLNTSLVQICHTQFNNFSKVNRNIYLSNLQMPISNIYSCFAYLPETHDKSLFSTTQNLIFES